MGWYGTYGATKQDVIAEILREGTWENEGGKHRILAHSVRGNVLWTVHEHIEPTGKATRLIGCYLLYQRDGEAGYKPMDETMGPNEVNCPLSYLNMVTEPENDWSREWREKVRAYHAKNTAARHLPIYVGSIVELPAHMKPNRFKVVQLKPLLGEPLNGTWGLYRIPRTKIERVLPEA